MRGFLVRVELKGTKPGLHCIAWSYRGRKACYDVGFVRRKDTSHSRKIPTTLVIVGL